MTVTDVIGYEYAHQPDWLLLVTSSKSWLEQQIYEALSDTANTAIVPWFHIVISQDLSANKKIIMLIDPLMTYLYMLQYMSA